MSPFVVTNTSWLAASLRYFRYVQYMNTILQHSNPAAQMLTGSNTLVANKNRWLLQLNSNKLLLLYLSRDYLRPFPRRRTNANTRNPRADRLKPEDWRRVTERRRQKKRAFLPPPHLNKQKARERRMVDEGWAWARGRSCCSWSSEAALNSRFNSCWPAPEIKNTNKMPGRKPEGVACFDTKLSQIKNRTKWTEACWQALALHFTFSLFPSASSWVCVSLMTSHWPLPLPVPASHTVLL